ncbi:MAG: hemagglutinin repeat-containing protein, partial [Proteobacteria bacterium]|nr:hemagglutinin repeat-containing protein [Pseudomonadota bacterium]
MTTLKQWFSIFLSFCLVYSQVFFNLAYAEGIETDGTTQTKLDKARNGVTIVNIAKPSSRGLSHNKFKKYNVSKQGVILNNADQSAVKTQLGGYIYGNRNLSSGSAKVILNEVTSNSRSHLNGFTEVAGQSADLVLVNPNGISMNGAGFINVPNITFSTGQANIDGGQIDSFSINQGDILIEGDGLHTKTQQATYIYTKSLQLNAKIHAQDLNVTLGSNKIDYQTKQATAQSTTPAQPDQVMLDSSALGGMYTNRITLVGTDKGVGVNLPPEVLASTGDITITADGKIQLNDLAAKTDITVTSTNDEIALQGTSHSGNATNLNAKTDITTANTTTVASEKEIHLTSGNAFTNQGTLMAGINKDGTANYTGTIELHNTELINQNKIATGTLNADNITNTNAEIAARAINATNLNNSQGTIKGGESVAITTNHLNNTDGNIEANKTLSIDSQTIDLDNSSLYANETLKLKLKALNNIASSQIQSNGDLNIEATDYITNDADILANKDLTLTTSGTLTNNSRLSAQEQLTVNANTLNNNASIASAQTLTTNTNTLNNYQTLFSGGDINLFTTGTLTNHMDANIFALENMTLAGVNSNSKANKIVNNKATIETYNGDMTIWTKDLQNIKDTPTKTSSTSDTIIRRIWTPSENAGTYTSTDFERINSVNTESITNIPQTSKILSGSDLIIDGDIINNHFSLLAANKDVNISTTKLTNNSLDAFQTTTLYDKYYKSRCKSSHDKHCTSWGPWQYTHSKTQSQHTIVVDRVSSTIQAGGDLSIIGTTVGNGEKKSGVALTDRTAQTSDTQNAATKDTSVDPNAYDIPLPQGPYGLFVRSEDPDSDYLIETNPEFALYANFISSDYMMKSLGFDPAATIKRIGDAFYENKLVRESIFKQTGRRYLNQYLKNDYDQFKYLMENALNASNDLNLVAGVSLSKDQINSLTSDIVWMEEKIVQGNRVLVPVVYLANNHNYALSGDAKIIAGDNVTVQVDNLINSGAMEAGDSIDIVATDAIANFGGSLSAQQDINLHAKNDITNLSGSIEGDNITIKSDEGSFIHETHAQAGRQDMMVKRTIIGDTATLHAKNKLSIGTGKDITFKGAKILAQNASLNAENINIETIQDKRSSKRGRTKTASTTHIGSSIEVASLDMKAANRAKIEGSSIAAEDKLKIQADQIDVLSVNDTTYYEKKSKSGNMFSSKSSSKERFTSKNKTSTLSAANMELVTTEGDINVVGSNLQATENLSLDAGNNLNIKAGHDGYFYEKKTKEGGLFRNGDFYSEEENLEGKMTKTAVASNISGANVSLKSNREILVEGSNLSGGTISGEAQNITVKAAENEEKTWSKKTEKSIGFGDLKDTLLQPHKAGKFKDKKLTLKIADAKYEESDTSTKKTTLSSSNLDGENIQLIANSEKEDQGNILVEGSTLNATDTISLTASNDVVVKEAKETTETKSASKKGTAELTANVKHQAVEVLKAAEALQLAIKAAQNAKDAYDDYKDQKKEAERNYKAGRIEKEDLDDIRDDERFYAASVTLTAAAVVSATGNLTSQVIAATQSSSTYGFNADIQLDIDAVVKKAKEISTRSVGSNLAASNIEINAGNRAVVQGSNLNAEEQIAIDANEVEIAASRDTSESSSSEDHAHFTYTWSAHGGPSYSASMDFSESDNKSATYNNSRLNSKNISITSKEDTYVTGAVVKAKEKLDLDVGGDLTVASLQDRS